MNIRDMHKNKRTNFALKLGSCFRIEVFERVIHFLRQDVWRLDQGERGAASVTIVSRKLDELGGQTPITSHVINVDCVCLLLGVFLGELTIGHEVVGGLETSRTHEIRLTLAASELFPFCLVFNRVGFTR
jgi:hypothetical protein